MNGEPWEWGHTHVHVRAHTHIHSQHTHTHTNDPNDFPPCKLSRKSLADSTHFMLQWQLAINCFDGYMICTIITTTHHQNYVVRKSLTHYFLHKQIADIQSQIV